MPQYEFEAMAADGSEVRDTIEAPDVKSAQAALRRKGLFVNRLERCISPDDLERRCPQCNHANNRDVSLCASCGAPLRGRRVRRDEPVELPAGFVVWENIDGSVTVTKTGWRRWKTAFSCLVLLTFLVGGWAFIYSEVAEDATARRIFAVIGMLGAAVLVPCTLWALFGHDEWRLGENLFDQKFSLLGMHWGRTFRNAVIRVEMRATHSSGSSSVGHSRTRITYNVLVGNREQSRTLCQERDSSHASAIGAFLAQRTGWPLDNRLGD